MADIEKIQPMGDSTQYTFRARTDSNGDVIKDSYLHLSGGTMTGQIKTSFKESVVPGLYESSQTTIPNLIEEVRFSSGSAGSFNLTTAYSLNGITVPTGWYNFIWIPHRTGGVNGTANSDNCNYGILYLHHMTSPTNGDFKISRNNGGIALARMDAEFTTAPTNGKPLLADGTQGGIKTGSVPWGDVSSKPSTYPPSSHTHDYAASSHTHNYAGSSSAGGAANSANVLNINNTMGLSGCLQYIQTSAQTSGNDLPTSAWWHCLKMNHGTGDTYYKRLLAFNFWGANDIRTATAEGNGSVGAWKRVWCEGNSVTSAVWNDYAEYRTAETIDSGYVLIEKGDDTLIKSTKRLQPYAGISSDTWGFAQGETETAKTPIAVAGRVLVYPYKNRNKYKPGMCVCTAPNGTVDIMHWWEKILYPDRIVGTVSCVPNYEEWGGGNDADRDPVKVDGRIWIKVR